jgi:glycosyltransferase involved in cell wall biosynthesis
MGGVTLAIVVHVIDFSGRNQWIEKHLEFGGKDYFKQYLVSISGYGEIHGYLNSIGLKNNYSVRRNLLGLLQFILLMFKFSRRDDLVIYAHGHLPSIYALLIKSFTSVDYVICHHQQPKYFEYLKRQFKFKGMVHYKLWGLYLEKAILIQSLSLETLHKLQDLGIPNDRIREIPFGLDFSRFGNQTRRFFSKNTYASIKIVSIGRLVWEKRFDLGVLAVSELVKLGIPLTYTIVGDGPLRITLMGLVKNLDLEDSVTFLGWRDDIPDILRNADILLNLSQTESYGQVLMEARLTGTPVFTSGVGVALDMEEANDPYVYVFKSATPKDIAHEFVAFKNSLFANHVGNSFDSTVTYNSHNLESVISATNVMFDNYFKARL